MSAALEVVRPGPATTVQDLGRFGFQRLGVPVSGALDAIALRLANALVGNPGATAGLEFRYAGPELRVAAGSARVAVCGNVELEVIGGRRRAVEPNRSHRLVAGEVVRIGAPRDAAVGYLAVEGGLALPATMGSLSTYARAKLGGLAGRALRAGDALPLALAEAPERAELALPGTPDYGSGPLRVVLGPQDDHFTAAAIDTLLGAEYVVSREADRMGLRLDGPALAHAAGADIASDGIATGCIQVPGSGRPILLLADHQTVGGYPKVATVISADLARAGRLRPGESLRFAAVTVAEAEAVRRSQEAAIGRLIAGLKPAPPTGGIDPDALARENLISGVVDPLDGRVPPGGA